MLKRVFSTCVFFSSAAASPLRLRALPVRRSMTTTSSNEAASAGTAKIVTKDRIYDQHWQQPAGTDIPKLKVWNSLTRSKVRLGRNSCQSSHGMLILQLRAGRFCTVQRQTCHLVRLSQP